MIVMQITMAGRLARALLLGETAQLSATELEALEAFKETVPPHTGWMVVDGTNGWWHGFCNVTGCMDDCVTLAAVRLTEHHNTSA